MANPEHVEIVKKGKAAILAWRAENFNTKLDLSGGNLSGVNLSGVNLSGADLTSSSLVDANLSHANLSGAVLKMTDLRMVNLTCANLSGANLTAADLREAILCEANLFAADLHSANLSLADLCDAELSAVSFNSTKLCGANFEGTKLGHACFTEVDLSEVKGLESVNHYGPCSIGIDTLYKFQGKIPGAFLRGCGVPEDLIAYLPSLIGAMEPIQFQSCFISYSSKDDEFARRLYDKMRGEKLRVWFDQEDMQGGKKVMEQIDRAIQVNDRLLLVLSDSSLKSEWVKTEIRKARKVERSDGRRKLFPIRLVSVSRLEKWKCFATDPDEDLAAEVRAYHIPDFSNWKDHDAFEAAFADLLRDLRAEA